MSLTAGLKFGEAVAKLWTLWLKSKDRRKLQKAIDKAESYIHCNEGFGVYEGQSDKVKDNRLDRYRKGFFKNNN